jgi:hypothetical protein
VLRDVEIYHTTAGGGVVAIAGVVVIMVAILEVAPSAYHGQWQGRAVAMAGESVQAWTSPAGGFVTITGYQFVD